MKYATVKLFQDKTNIKPGRRGAMESDSAFN
jgi:hypothetical protein